MKIDHIGIAVKSLAASVKMYEDSIGLKATGYETVEDQGVHLAMIPVGESRLELLELLHSDSPIEKFMAKRGEGIHHIALAGGQYRGVTGAAESVGRAAHRFEVPRARRSQYKDRIHSPLEHARGPSGVG